jgi:hypothetical protein
VLTPRARHRREHGQVLILALAFIAFFGLLTAAVLQLADTVELQQSHSQAATTADADTEGGMLLAAQAAQAQGSCRVPSTGSVTMTSGDTAAYQTNACNPGATANLIADQCAACVLGQSGNTQPLTVDGSLTAQGPIAVNGAVTPNGGTITSTLFSPSGPPGFIGCHPGCGPNPNPATDFTPAASDLSAPASPEDVTFPGVTAPAYCPDTYNGTDGGMIPRGCYSSISVDCSTAPNGSCSYTMEQGTLILEGPFNIGSAAGDDTSVTVEAPDSVLLAFAQVPGSAGSLLVGSDATLTLEGGPRPDNDGVTFYVDPFDTIGTFRIDRGGSVYVSGTVYAPAASVELHGGPGTGDGTLTTAPSGADPESGRLIVGSLDIGQHGAVNVTATPPTPGYCWVYSDTVTVTTAASTNTGEVVVESNCSGEAGVKIISINYGS